MEGEKKKINKIIQSKAAKSKGPINKFVISSKKGVSLNKLSAPLTKIQPLVEKQEILLNKNPSQLNTNEKKLKKRAPIQAPKPTMRLLNDTDDNRDKQVVAVIVTFCTGQSYDQLFQTVEQKSLEGTKVEVYACDSLYLPQLNQAFDGNPKDEVAERLLASIKQVQNDCVVFNWQCCSGYAQSIFVQTRDLLFGFLKKLIYRGYMCMFSDFSLKALIRQWKQEQLGPNPFVTVKQFEGMFEVRFNCQQLKQCPSSQLQIIGDMAQKGHCSVHALQGTIRYCVDSEKINHQVYKLQVLTVVTTKKPTKQNLISKIGQFEGSAGHVLLRYPSGGMILTSMGHWVQLMKIDTSEKKLFEVAEQEFGAEQAVKMKQEYQKMDLLAQKDYVASKARQFVRNQAPCLNMNKKKRK